MKALTHEQLVQALRLHQDHCVNSFGTQSKCWTVLASGPDKNLQHWAMACWPDFFDRRKQTARCRIWCSPDQPIESAVLEAVEAAKQYDVTLQLLCVHGANESTREFRRLGGVFASVAAMRETYPILHLGIHRMKWGDA